MRRFQFTRLCLWQNWYEYLKLACDYEFLLFLSIMMVFVFRHRETRLLQKWLRAGLLRKVVLLNRFSRRKIGLIRSSVGLYGSGFCL